MESARKALRRLDAPRRSASLVSRLLGKAWSATGRPWVLPVIASVGVGLLQAGGSGHAPLAVFHDAERSRELLGILWQVEGATVALVLAASLFAFESLSRQRSNVPLVEYANRSWLAQFLMLAASGLVAVPIVLFATPDLPAPSASFAAVLIGVSGLMALPFFFARAMKVVQPSWLRGERLRDIRYTTRALVDKESLERAALLELRRWAESCQVEVLHRMVIDGDRVTEVSPAAGVVLDLDLDRIEPIAKAHPDEVVVATRLMEEVWGAAPLLGRMQPATPTHERRAVTVSRHAPTDKMDQLVEDLHEEGLEAVRSGSPAAAEQVAAMYGEVWLAWPKAWAEYGQRLQGGLIEGVEPFRIKPTDRLRRNIATTIGRSVDQGLSDHVHAFAGILYTVGFDAIRLQAYDLVKEMNTLARWLFSIESSAYPAVADVVAEAAWRFQIELCEFAGRELEMNRADLSSVEEAREPIGQCFRSIVESLRQLFDGGKFELFRSLDHRFQRILAHWDPTRGEPLADLILHDPERFGADDERVAGAHEALSMAAVKRELEQQRRAGRLSVLGWILRQKRSHAIGEDEIILIRNLSGTLGSVPDLVHTTGVSLADAHDTLSHWIMLERPELEVGFVDTDGPILKAFAHSLLSRPSVDEIPAASWINSNHVSRLNEILDELADWSELWRRLGESEGDVSERAELLKSLLQSALDRQVAREHQELAEQELDAEKVEEFVSTVVRSWMEHRLLPEFARLSGLGITEIRVEEWTGPTFGFKPMLDPKGLFVSPTNWVGLDHVADDRGRVLAQGEVTAIVELATVHAREVASGGEPSERLSSLLEQLRVDGFNPSLIVVPIDWRLADSLGLDDHNRHRRGVGLGRNFQGRHDGVPVIDWWDVPSGRAFAMDMSQFCEVIDGVAGPGESSPPNVAVEPIDGRRADEIIARWEDESIPESDQVPRHELLTSVRIDIRRPYEVRLRSSAAVRSIVLADEEPSV